MDIMQTPSALTLHETRPGTTALKAKQHLKHQKRSKDSKNSQKPAKQQAQTMPWSLCPTSKAWGKKDWIFFRKTVWYCAAFADETQFHRLHNITYAKARHRNRNEIDQNWFFVGSTTIQQNFRATMALRAPCQHSALGVWVPSSAKEPATVPNWKPYRHDEHEKTSKAKVLVMNPCGFRAKPCKPLEHTNRIHPQSAELHTWKCKTTLCEHSVSHVQCIGAKRRPTGFARLFARNSRIRKIILIPWYTVVFWP